MLCLYTVTWVLLRHYNGRIYSYRLRHLCDLINHRVAAHLVTTKYNVDTGRYDLSMESVFRHLQDRHQRYNAILNVDEAPDMMKLGLAFASGFSEHPLNILHFGPAVEMFGNTLTSLKQWLDTIEIDWG